MNANLNLAESTGRADAERSGQLMRLATYASISVAGTLVVAKLLAWLSTDSIALLSSLVDSLLDVGASLVNLLAVRHALQPADREHRFGHGKLESIAGLGQSAFIVGSAIFLLFEAGNRVVHPRAIAHGDAGIAVMVFSIVVTLALVVFQSYVVRRTSSLAITADSIHYRSDLLMNLGVILALVLSQWLGWFVADPIIAILIAIYILYSAFMIIRQSFDALMDRELPDDDRRRIREIAVGHPEVHSIHDLRTRSAGRYAFIQFHLVLDADLPLLRAHEIADEVEAEVLAIFPDAEVIIHQDPEGIDEDVPVFR